MCNSTNQNEDSIYGDQNIKLLDELLVRLLQNLRDQTPVVHNLSQPIYLPCSTPINAFGLQWARDCLGVKHSQSLVLAAATICLTRLSQDKMRSLLVTDFKIDLCHNNVWWAIMSEQFWQNFGINNLIGTILTKLLS